METLNVLKAEVSGYSSGFTSLFSVHNHVYFKPVYPYPGCQSQKNDKKKKIKEERKFLPSRFPSSQFSFHLNFEALVPRVVYPLLKVFFTRF